MKRQRRLKPCPQLFETGVAGLIQSAVESFTLQLLLTAFDIAPGKSRSGRRFFGRVRGRAPRPQRGPFHTVLEPSGRHFRSVRFGRLFSDGG